MTFVAALCLPAGASQAGEHAAPQSIHEKDVRAISSKRYSELLRLACFHGWRFRSDDIMSGFSRNYEETRLAFIDAGYMILPDAAPPRLIVAAIIMGARPQSAADPEPGCFRARWSNE